MYNAEIEFHEDSHREQDCATLQEAVDLLNAWGAGHQCARVWINNVEQRRKACTVVGLDGEPLCTNEQWHAIFASEQERIRPRAESLRIPTNPQTYADRKEEL
jgi:hypothetical protein